MWQSRVQSNRDRALFTASLVESVGQHINPVSTRPVICEVAHDDDADRTKEKNCKLSS